MGLDPKVTLPAASTFGLSGGTGAKSVWAGGTLKNLLEKIQDEIGYDAESGRGSSLGVGWSPAAAATASMEVRMRRLESLGVYDAALFNILPDGATDNTGAFNFALSALNGAGGGILELEGNGDYWHTGAINWPSRCQNVYIRGKGTNTIIRYKGSLAAGSKTMKIAGVPQADFSQRAEDCGLLNLTRYCDAAGSSAVIGMSYESCTGMMEERVHYVGWRDAARYGIDYADSINRNCTYDFCASTDDSNKSVIRYTALDTGYWACDSIAELHPRFENNGDRLFDARPSPDASKRCAKLYILEAPKSESSVAQMGGSSGVGADGTKGAAFYLDSVTDFMYMGGDITLQTMRAGHAVIPTIFKLLNCYGVRIETCINIGAGTNGKCFTNFFDIDSGSGFSIRCFFLTGNNAANPTNEFKFSNTPTGLDRRGTHWAFYPGTGTPPPKADSGTVPSATDW